MNKNKDTNKEIFSTGAQRDSQSKKPRPDLISPFATMRKGVVMQTGASHYGERNYEKGMPISRCVASANRHLLQFIMGDTSEDHVAQLGINADFIMHYQEMIKLGLLPKELDDMPKYLEHKK